MTPVKTHKLETTVVVTHEEMDGGCFALCTRQRERPLPHPHTQPRNRPALPSKSEAPPPTLSNYTRAHDTSEDVIWWWQHTRRWMPCSPRQRERSLPHPHTQPRNRNRMHRKHSMRWMVDALPCSSRHYPWHMRLCADCHCVHTARDGWITQRTVTQRPRRGSRSGLLFAKLLSHAITE